MEKTIILVVVALMVMLPTLSAASSEEVHVLLFFANDPSLVDIAKQYITEVGVSTFVIPTVNGGFVGRSSEAIRFINGGIDPLPPSFLANPSKAFLDAICNSETAFLVIIADQKDPMLSILPEEYYAYSRIFSVLITNGIDGELLEYAAVIGLKSRRMTTYPPNLLLLLRGMKLADNESVNLRAEISSLIQENTEFETRYEKVTQEYIELYQKYDELDRELSITKKIFSLVAVIIVAVIIIGFCYRRTK